MSNVVIITGRSDDIINIEGTLSKQFYAKVNEPTTIEFDNGDQFEIEYTKGGNWEIRPQGELVDDMSSVDVEPTGSVTAYPEYTQVCFYRPWNGVESVEVVDL